MQPGDSLYIEDFNLEPLQMSSQLILPDMDALRLNRSRGMCSPGVQLHNLMPVNTHGLPNGHLTDLHDPLRHLSNSIPCSMIQTSSHHTLASMKYPGTPPDTPPGSSPSPPYHTLTTTTSMRDLTASISSPSTINVEVSEILWKNYQDQPIDLRGQCDLGRDPGDLQEAKWLSSLDYSSPDEMRQVGLVAGMSPNKTGGANNGVVVDDEQVVSTLPCHN